MKLRIEKLIERAIQAAKEKDLIAASQLSEIQVEEPKNDDHGDYSTNIALTSASILKMPPRRIAENLVSHMDTCDGLIQDITIAGPGFINFKINPSAWANQLSQIHDLKDRYGSSTIGQGIKVLLEFVSANPTGPLHVGHGRGAAIGDSLSRILSFCGYDVEKEYYINDTGRQIKTLGQSVYLRYRELCGEKIIFPEDCYQGNYIKDIAIEEKEKNNNNLLDMQEDHAVLQFGKTAALDILNTIKSDLLTFDVQFDTWFSEQSLYDSDSVNQVIEQLKSSGIIFEKDNAWWFRSSDFGDEKDRVVIRQNGQTTYFASDIAYHINKYKRGFNMIIDIWGADHHGYIQRLSASIEASGYNRSNFHIILVQFVNLLRHGEPVAMSTRSGEFVTLNEVIQEVGTDAARFIFLTRHHDSPLDFDLEVAKMKSNENPVYYVQYVHARVASIIRNAHSMNIPIGSYEESCFSNLIEPEEIHLLKCMGRFPEIVEKCAVLLEPHRLVYYLMDLASYFHAYYNKHRVISEDISLTQSRICLVEAVKIIIKNGLSLLGVSSPESM